MEQPLSKDLMVGVGAIARFTGQPERRIFYLLQEGLLPGFKIGRMWMARRSTLVSYFAEREQAARRAPRTTAA